MNKIALSLLLFSLSILPLEQQVIQKQLINAIHRLDVDAVSRLAKSGELAHVNMVEVFKELSLVERQIEKTLNVKAAIKGAAGLLCMAIAGRFIYNAYSFNEDSQDSVADLFWRLLYGRPGKVLVAGGTPHVFNLPLIAFSGSLFTVGSYWATGGYKALYKKPLNNLMQQKLTAIAHILMSVNAHSSDNVAF